jgi:hypothetical protein
MFVVSHAENYKPDEQFSKKKKKYDKRNAI